MKNLMCSGTEYRLTDCSYSGGGDGHNQDWSITCNNGIQKILICIIIKYIIMEW